MIALSSPNDRYDSCHVCLACRVFCVNAYNKCRTCSETGNGQVYICDKCIVSDRSKHPADHKFEHKNFGQGGGDDAALKFLGFLVIDIVAPGLGTVLKIASTTINVLEAAEKLEMSKEFKEFAAKMFDQIDVDRSGVLSPDEIASFFTNACPSALEELKTASKAAKTDQDRRVAKIQKFNLTTLMKVLVIGSRAEKDDDFELLSNLAGESKVLPNYLPTYLGRYLLSVR